MSEPLRYPTDLMIHRWQRWSSAHSVIAGYQRRCSFLSASLFHESVSTLGSLKWQCVLSCAEEECSRQSWSLFVLADSRVILLPIGVMDTGPLRLVFPLFKIICHPPPPPSIHKSCDISRLWTWVCLYFTAPTKLIFSIPDWKMKVKWQLALNSLMSMGSRFLEHLTQFLSFPNL